MTTALSMIMDVLDAHRETPLVCRRGEWLTGAELTSRITSRAAAMAEAGLKPGDTALILVSDNLASIETLLGCWMLGAAGCFVDFRAPSARIEEWVARLEPSLVISQRPINGIDLHLQRATPENRIMEGFTPSDRPDRLALIFASSGTTGQPKLHPRAQGALARNVIKAIEELQLTPDGATLSALSVGYSASCFLWLRNLVMGKPIIAFDLVFSIAELDAALQRLEVTECVLPPSWIRRLNTLEGEAPRYRHLQRLGAVGGPMATDDMVTAVTKLSPGFGISYSCVGIGLISRICGAEILAKPGSCGRPMDGIDVTIWNQDQICGANEIGEISVSRAESPATRPGDLGWMDADGYLYISSRVDGLLCRNGVNFSTERIVQAALSMAEVTEAAVVPAPDADGGDRVHLFVEARAAIADDLARHLNRSLPGAERPDQIHVREVMPVNTAGKVDLRSLAVELERMAPDG